MNTIDLHVHSTHSDGSLTPRELVKNAKKKKLLTISVTDHDTVSQNTEALTAGEEYGIEVLSGVEVSADFSPGTMHILGYGINPDHPELVTMLEAFRKGRDERNPKIIEKLNAAGLAITYEDVLNEAGGITIGRPHIARVLIKKGLVHSNEEAFEKYLKKGARAYVDRVRFSPKHIITVIHHAGGLAFLAHPKQLLIPHDTTFRALVTELVTYGLDGIEVYSSCHSKDEVRQYKKIAEDYRLLVSGGSDYHGGAKNHIDLGYVGRGIELPYEIVEKIKERITSKKK